MIESGGGARLTPESFQSRGIAHFNARQELHGHVTFQPLVVSLVNLTHSSRADECHYGVGSDPLSGGHGVASHSFADSSRSFRLEESGSGTLTGQQRLHLAAERLIAAACVVQQALPLRGWLFLHCLKNALELT